jgi:CRP-like cAMP-binding protein
VAVDADLVESLPRLGLFAGIERAQLDSIVALAEEVRYPEGVHVVRAGDTDVKLHVIVDGEVAVVIDDAEVAVLPRGSFFGEISTLLDEPATADVIARTPLRCLALPRDAVEQLLLEHPRLTLAMLRAEARRLRSRDESRT